MSIEPSAYPTVHFNWNWCVHDKGWPWYRVYKVYNTAESPKVSHKEREKKNARKNGFDLKIKRNARKI